MKRRILVVQPAAREIRAAIDWYDEHRPGWGNRFRMELEVAMESLERGFDASPDSSVECREDDPDFRRLLLRRFPYAVVFYVEDNTVHVVAVAHLRRLPGYWQDRVEPE